MSKMTMQAKIIENNNEKAPGQGSARGLILGAARSLFAEKGFEGASTQEIADRAGVNKRLVFYYFKSKEDLYLAALEDFFQKLELMLENFCVTPEDLQRVAARYFRKENRSVAVLVKPTHAAEKGR